MIRLMLWLGSQAPGRLWFAAKWLRCALGFWHTWEPTGVVCCRGFQDDPVKYRRQCRKCGREVECDGYHGGYP